MAKEDRSVPARTHGALLLGDGLRGLQLCLLFSLLLLELDVILLDTWHG